MTSSRPISHANGNQRRLPVGSEPPQATSQKAAWLKKVNEGFSAFAHATAHVTGRPIAFLIAALLVVVWGLSGPLFGYSDTWQLVINTSTTIVTFLMVFLIQSTQNRDTMALQIKLSELIIALKEPSNDVATAEDLSEEDLEKLHAHYCEAAEHTLNSLETRRRMKSESTTRS